MKASDLSVLNTPEGRQRLLTGAILAPIVLALVYFGGILFAALIMLVTGAGLYEWLRLVDAKAPKNECYTMFGALALVLLLAADACFAAALIAVILCTVAFYYYRHNEDPLHAPFFALGLPYMAVSGLAIIYLRDTSVTGFRNAAYLLAVVWGMDIGGYVAGKLIGGPKLAPKISPGKTWAGFGGGIALAVILSAIVLAAGHAQDFFFGLLLAVALAAVAQGGDLFKSFFKRRAGVKDSGTLIPGHGGVLDRIDGLVFAAIVMAFLQAICSSNWMW